MSKFSGKCDCYDTLIMIHQYTLEELQNNVNIYVGDNKEPLYIEKMSDLIPYYPYIIGMSYFNNKEKKSVVYLSSESYVDIEEKESLEFYLKQIIKIYNRCKRKKTEFNIDEVVKEVCWSDWNKKQITELAIKVKEKGKKATIDGIHLPFKDYYRKMLVDEMIANGLNPSDYGYDRFV